MAVHPQLSRLPLGTLRSARPDLFEGIDEAVVFRVPMRVRFRGVTERNGVLLRGPAGWGECAPFWDYDAAQSVPWLMSALACAGVSAAEGGDTRTVGSLRAASSPIPVRDSVPVNVTVPVIPVDAVASRLDSQPGCSTAKVKVADRGTLDQGDRERVAETARLLAERYGSSARVRVDANAAWSVGEAARALEELDAAASPVGGLEYAEQPCRTVAELSRLRRLTGVRIAADESIRLSGNPLEVRDYEAADVAVMKVAPLGGVGRALQLSAALGLPAVVSSALDTSVGLAAGVRLAAALPELDFACGLNTGSLLAADVIDQPLLSSAVRTPGRLTVADADRVIRGDLTKQADSAPLQLVEDWIDRLRAVLGEAPP